MNEKLLKAAIAELVGTFTLVFVGGMVVTVASPDNGGVVAPALGHGLILIALAFAYGTVSGGHFNPAVTASLLVGGKHSLLQSVVYWIMQFLGAVIAAVVINAVVPAGSNLGQTTGSLTFDAANNPSVTAAVIEFFLAFLLVTTIYQTAVHGRAGNLAPIAIGLTLAGCIFAAGVYTGASVNPARTFGPALIAGDLSYVPLYFIGLFGGGIVGGLFNAYILTPNKD
jgi:aquaporin Z